jgi:hypothetical protein
MKLPGQILISGSKAAISYTSDPNVIAVAKVATFQAVASPYGAERLKSDAAESWLAQVLDRLPRPRVVKAMPIIAKGMLSADNTLLSQ